MISLWDVMRDVGEIGIGVAILLFIIIFPCYRIEMLVEKGKYRLAVALLIGWLYILVVTICYIGINAQELIKLL